MREQNLFLKPKFMNFKEKHGDDTCARKKKNAGGNDHGILCLRTNFETYETSHFYFLAEFLDRGFNDLPDGQIRIFDKWLFKQNFIFEIGGQFTFENFLAKI